ncbi:hypothetical protein COM89_26945 [Bacillus thuringiensis]|uniref:hypothetical protein n=1 Tax=Bacillus thuringiensis TaxID=1428 RepID=UPI000BEBCA5D|nr:hypothetical protein [Bacillus thuringiensis]PEB72619.1 hypothetical protein COM89_26945 [Bacillus thuringiensis]
MTISVAWVRNVGGCEELIIASDSRLCGGIRWDQCPKIATLPRSDTAICFAGSSLYTYPLMSQLTFAIDSYSRSKERAMDIHDLRGHTLNIFNELQESIRFELPINKRDELKDAEFILGGYSWIHKKFSLWRIHYSINSADPKQDKFVYASPASFKNFGSIIFAGDKAEEARKRLINLLQEKYGNDFSKPENKLHWDWEPFEVIRDMIREAEPKDTIGGPPQLVKVYQHMTCRPIGVNWNYGGKQIKTLLGRTLLEYEDCDFWFLDPDTLVTSKG